MLMTRKEGNSFNRIHGYESTSYPERVDYDRVRNIFNKLDGALAYYNGMLVTDEQIKRVQERLTY